MIEEIEKRISQLKRIGEDLNTMINEAIRQNAKFLIDLNVQQQLKGLDAKGSKIGTYAESTKKSRRRKGLQVSFVDLEDTKNYHHGFAIHYGKDFVEIAAPDIMYSLFLDNRYKNLTGLTEESLEVLRKQLRPFLDAELSKRLS